MVGNKKGGKMNKKGMIGLLIAVMIVATLFIMAKGCSVADKYIIKQNIIKQNKEYECIYIYNQTLICNIPNITKQEKQRIKNKEGKE